MNKLLYLIMLFFIISCGGSTTRMIFGTTEKNLIKTVGIEQNCPIEQIKITEKVKGLHGATYALEVCNRRIVYKQVGSVFMEANKADEMIKTIQN